MSRRAPAYIVIETSRFMPNDTLADVVRLLNNIVHSLRCDPYSLESSWLSVIVFAAQARQLVPLTELEKFMPPGKLEGGYGCLLGRALEQLDKTIQAEVKRPTATEKGDWKPSLLLISSGNMDDETSLPLNYETSRFSQIYAVAAGNQQNIGQLGRITQAVLSLEHLSSSETGGTNFHRLLYEPIVS